MDTNPYSQDVNDSFKGKYMSKLSTFGLLLPALLLFVLGAFPEIMNRIGELGQEFFFGHNPDHEVNYFAWINIKGALVSLAIGAIVYFLIIRTFFIARDENGYLKYINPWPKYLDLEKYIYRPVLGIVLPNIGGFIANTLGNLVGKIADFEIGLFKMVDNLYTKRLSIHEDEEEPNKLGILLNKIMPESMASGLLQFTIALAVILVLVMFI